MQYHSGSDHFPLSIHIPLTVPRAPLATRYYLPDDYKDAFVDAVGTAVQNHPRAYISSQADLLANFITSSMDVPLPTHPTPVLTVPSLGTSH
jgi:hypothetical protein